MKETKIASFSGEFSFLSNFASSPIYINGMTWDTVEHYYQACKSLDYQYRKSIRMAGSPGKAKRLGQKVKLRHDWEAVKQDVMLTCIRLKFERSTPLAKMLLGTNDMLLIEGNYWHDNFWGDCFCLECKNIKGENSLGNILMKRRCELSATL